MAPDPLSLAVAAVRAWLSTFTAAAWEKSPGVSDTDMQAFAVRMAPAVAASQMRVANLVTAKVARDHGGARVPVDKELVTLARGVDPIQVYERPIIATRTALSEGKSYPDARKLGLLRARQLCLTDVQMAKVRQTDVSLQAAGQTFYRRVPTGPATCALCLIAATQPYKVGKLMPIHPGCDCGIEAIPAGMNLDHLLDTKALLEATHAKVKAFTAIEDRGGRAVDYRKLLITREHGEIGPLLAWDGQQFTGSKDIIPGSADGHEAKPVATSPDESKADIARRHLPLLEQNLANLRATGHGEDSGPVAYHKQQIEKYRATLADQASIGGTLQDAPARTRSRVIPDNGPEPGTESVSSGGGGGNGGGGNRTGLGDPGDDDRAKYRATSPDQRELDPRHAQPLGEVVDAAAAGDRAPLKQLAADLSGVVTARDGKFVVTFGSNSLGDAAVEGRIHLDGSSDGLGLIGRTFRRDQDNRLVVSNDALFLGESMQNRGFAAALAPRLEEYYRRSGVDRIEVHAADTGGGYAWARQDFDWDPEKVEQSIGSVVQRITDVSNQVKSREARQVLADMQARLVDARGRIRPLDELPSPRVIADLATSDVDDLGKQVMMGSNWYGRKYL